MKMKILKLLSLEKLAYLIIFLLPIYLVKINFLFFPTNVLEILIWIMFFVWFFRGKKNNSVKKYYVEYRKYIFVLNFLFLGLLISTFVSGAQNVSWGIIKSWFFIPMLFLFLLFKVLNDEEKIKRVFDVFFFSAFGVSIIAVAYLFFGKLTFDSRLQAFFNSPNYLGMYLTPALIIFLEKGQIVKEKSWKNIFFSLSFLLILLVFYKTYSYLAWLSVLASYLFVFSIKNKLYFSGKTFLSRKILLFLSILVILVLSQCKTEKFRNLATFDAKSSFSSRIMIWKATSRILEDNFVFGVGPGNFQEKYLEYQKFFPPYLEWAVPHPHNIFLSFWLSGGILSLGSFLILLYFYFQDIFLRIKKENKTVFFLSLGIMLAILIHGLFDTTYFKNDLAVIFWINFLVLKLG